MVVDPTETGGGEAQAITVPVMPPADWDMYGGAAAVLPSTFVGAPGGSMQPPSAPMRPAPMQSPAMSKSRGARKRSTPARSLAESLIKPVASAIEAVMSRGGGDFDDEAESFDSMDASYEAMAMPLSADRQAPAEVRKEEVAGIPLAALVMRQRLDGSFAPTGTESVAAATAAALVRLLEAGNTDLRGTYRQAVSKAVAWLLGALSGLAGGHADRAAVMGVLKQWVESTGTPSAKERFAAAVSSP